MSEQQFTTLLNLMETGFKEINAKLDSHSEILEKHGKILVGHSEILERHGKILDGHSEILDKHSKILASHSARFDRLDERLESLELRVERIETYFNEDVIGMLKHVNGKVTYQEENTRYLEKKFIEMDKRLTKVEARVNN